MSGGVDDGLNAGSGDDAGLVSSSAVSFVVAPVSSRAVAFTISSGCIVVFSVVLDVATTGITPANNELTIITVINTLSNFLLISSLFILFSSNSFYFILSPPFQSQVIRKEL